ncbi:putative casein kinase I [Tricholoma matsutake]|nr:putative casein kinase I [Tricholoma matsutake 945]
MDLDIIRLDGRYRLQRRVGTRSFGEIYLACDILSGQPIIIKLEPLNSDHQMLEHEFHVYCKLCEGVGIPEVYWFGMECGFNVMAMDLLGHSLEDLFIQCQFRFSIKTVLLLGRQLLCRLQYMHARNFLHRDLKPNNIAVGVGQKASVVYLIDFGLSKQFRDPNTHMHILYINMCGLTGTAVFTSIHSHIGWELGRWDDLELLAHILIYFLCGSLLWQSLGHQDVEENFVLKLKQQINVHDLCHNLPVEFRKFLEYMRSLSFDNKPDYNYLYDLSDGLLSQEGFPNDLSFDWSVDGGQSGGKDRHGACNAYNKSGIC